MVRIGSMALALGEFGGVESLKVLASPVPNADHCIDVDANCFAVARCRTNAPFCFDATIP
jgi:hypothetical protein